MFLNIISKVVKKDWEQLCNTPISTMIFEIARDDYKSPYSLKKFN